MLAHFEKLFNSKPKNKTGRQVVAQKLQTAQKTNILSLTEHGLVSGCISIDLCVCVMLFLLSKSYAAYYVAIFIGGNS